jgi:hypothetical protein
MYFAVHIVAQGSRTTPPQLRSIKSWPGHQAVLTAVSLGLPQSAQVNTAMAPPLAHDRFPCSSQPLVVTRQLAS